MDFTKLFERQALCPSDIFLKFSLITKLEKLFNFFKKTTHRLAASILTSTYIKRLKITRDTHTQTSDISDKTVTRYVETIIVDKKILWNSE